MPANDYADVAVLDIETREETTRPLTPEEVEQRDAQAAAAEAEAAANAALRSAIVGLAQSAEGVALNDLTLAQRNALLAIVLWKAGAVAPDLTVKALSEWARE